KNEFRKENVKKDWAVSGAKGRVPNLIRSLYMQEGVLEEHNKKLQEKYSQIIKKEIRFEPFKTEDAEIILVAYGSMARLGREVVNRLREDKVKAGLLRPITLWPFPKDVLKELADRAKFFFVVEMSAGQMVEDVRLSVEGKIPVYFYGRMGGGVPTPLEVLEKVKEKLNEDRG
ncbi:3-methyl-2-oxobutanoate dehydrogenase subunit beta, partial [Candidatus Aerophobetes bacterium]